MPTVFEFAYKLSNSFVRISHAAFLIHECKKFWRIKNLVWQAVIFLISKYILSQKYNAKKVHDTCVCILGKSSSDRMHTLSLVRNVTKD